MTGLIYNLLPDSAPNSNIQILFVSPPCKDENKNQKAALVFVFRFLKKKKKKLKHFWCKKCQWKKSLIQSEPVSPLDDRVGLGVLNLPPSIVMRETDLQLCLAGARRWRQGVLDLRLSLAPVKEPLNCSTVELCPPRITQGSADCLHSTVRATAFWFCCHRLLLSGHWHVNPALLLSPR